MTKKILFLSIISGTLLLLFFSTIPLKDYGIYSRATRIILEHPEYLYTDKVTGFYCMPWIIYILTPLSFLPDYLGQATLNLFSLAGVIVAIKILCPYDDLYSFCLALFTPSYLSITYLGQWDALVFAAATLAYWTFLNQRWILLGVCSMIALTKPTNIVLIIGLLLLQLSRQNIRIVLITLYAPCLMLLTTFPLFGFDWIARYIAYTKSRPPFGYSISIWSIESTSIVFPLVAFAVAGALFAFCWKKNFSHASVALLLIGNLLISPYLTPYGIVSIAPALGIIAFHKRALGLLLSFLGFLAFYLFLNQHLYMPLYSYILICFLLLFWLIIQDEIEAPTPEVDRYTSIVC